jgi:hypothetical protein
MKNIVVIFSVVVSLSIVGCSSTAPQRESRVIGDAVVVEGESRTEKLAQQEEILRRQREKMAAQEREYQDLKRQEAVNERVREYEAR